MHPAVRALGTLLRLVGISSPEDTATHPVESAKPTGPPAWRSELPPAPPPAPPRPSPSSSTPPSNNPPSV